MKIFAVLFLVFAVANANVVPRDGASLAEKVKHIIDNIFGLLPEVVAITEVKIDIPDNDLIKGYINIKEISLTGFKTPKVEVVEYDDAADKLVYDLDFEKVSADVELDVVLEGLVDVNHHFKALFDLGDLDGSGYAVVVEDPEKTTEVTDFEILVQVEKIVADIEDLFGDADLSKQVTDEINENGAKNFDEAMKTASPAISGVIKDLINLIIKIASTQ